MSMVGVCGDNCLYCPRHIATRTGKAEELEKVKELWVRIGLRDPAFPAGDLACQGCMPENRCAYSDLRSCVYERNIGSCRLCDDYPCRLVIAVIEKSEEQYGIVVKACTLEEADLLRLAFFSKRQNIETRRHR